MFYRVVTRCLSVAKKPLSYNQSSGSSNQWVTFGLLNPSPLNKCICTSVSRWVSQTEEERQGLIKTADAQKLEDLLASDPEIAKRYKVLELEIDVMKQGGYACVPETLRPQHWLQLLKAESRSGRKKYLQYLFLTEMTRKNQKKKKEVKRLEREKQLESGGVELSEYRLNKTSMFLRIYDTAVNHFYNSRLIQAMQFGEKLVIDCGYHDQMTLRECSECAKQLGFLFAENRQLQQPFDLHFCNVNKSSIIMEKFIRIIPTAYNPDFPLNIHEGSYTEVFDRDKLIYLTPHTNNEMKDYDHDSIYIIGGIVDKTNSQPLSLARAKKDGLRMAKLPLDKYLLFGAGAGKRLPLNQMVSILSDIRVTGDWKIAFRHVPKRKLEYSIDQMSSEPSDQTKPQSFDRMKPQSFDRTKHQSFDRKSTKFEFGYNQRSRQMTETEGKDVPSFNYKARQKGLFNK